MPTHNDWHVQLALKSTRSLSDVIDQMTEADCMKALELETGSRRRTVIVDRLILKVADIRHKEVIANLKEKFKWHEANQLL